MLYIRHLTIFLAAMLIIEGVGAQSFPRGASGRGNFDPSSRSDMSDGGRAQDDYADERDTFGVFTFFSENPNLEAPYADSLLSNFFHQYDPARSRDLDYMHLGNPGSAAQPFLYTPRFRRGFDVGLHQYDLYLTEVEDVPYRRLEKPYTNAAYMQVGDQSDTYFTGEFSRNFAKGLNINLDYKRLSMLGRQNHFPNQNARNTALSVGMWFHGEKGKYDGFFAISSNTIEQQDNGGLEVEPTTGDQFSTPSSAQVFLNSAETRHTHREFSYTHYFKFGGQEDSIRGLKRAYTLGHQISFRNSNYRFSDTLTGFLRPYSELLVSDFRGLRFAVQHQKIENTFRLSTFRLQNKKRNDAQGQRDYIELGINHAIHQLDFESADSTINNLFLFGKINFNPSPGLKINTYAHLGILDNVGDFRISGELFLDFKKLGQLEVSAANQLSSPTLMQSRFIVSQRDVWKNNFKKTLENSIAATYRIEQFKFAVTGKYHLVNNAIYFDTAGIAQQTGTPISILQLIVQKDFALGNFHLDNVVSLQQMSEDFIRLPSLYAKHSLYYAGQWFGVLNVRLGFDVRYNNTYFAPYYNPLTGQFQQQDEREVEWYPGLDAFFSMRVTRFRAYVKWENLVNTITPERLFYQTAFYAHWQGGLRLGLKWRFVN